MVYPSGPGQMAEIYNYEHEKSCHELRREVLFLAALNMVLCYVCVVLQMDVKNLTGVSVLAVVLAVMVHFAECAHCQ
jgi:hypothetical protein